MTYSKRKEGDNNLPKKMGCEIRNANAGAVKRLSDTIFEKTTLTEKKRVIKNSATHAFNL